MASLNQNYNRQTGPASVSSQESDVNCEGPGNHLVAQSYKEMFEIMKHLNSSCDDITEKICELNMKYAETTTKSALLIDPDVAKILLDDNEICPVVTASQQLEKMGQQELHDRHMEMSEVLDQYARDRSEKNCDKTSRMDIGYP